MWADKYLRNWVPRDGVRPRSLVLVGESKTGKTAWARSLGKHCFFSSLFNLSLFDEDAQYAVFDDVDFDFFPGYKGWLGGQQEFTATDKYERKRRVVWGKPCIVCVNTQNDPRRMKNADREWLRKNCVFVDIERKLYRDDNELPLDDWEIENQNSW